MKKDDYYKGKKGRGKEKYNNNFKGQVLMYIILEQ